LWCFWAPHAETAINAIKKFDGKTRKDFFSQLFDMDFPHFLYGVFELPLLRNAQKRHKQISKIKKKITYLPHLVAICQIYVAFKFLFLRRPLLIGKGICKSQAGPAKK
jgi:hypothetical protein